MYILLLFHFVPSLSCSVPVRLRSVLLGPVPSRSVAVARSRPPCPPRSRPLAAARENGAPSAADPDWWKLTGLKKFKCVPHFVPHFYKMCPTCARAKGHFQVVRGRKRPKYDHFSTFSDFDIDVPHVPQMGHKK